jgi:1-aminocyclopropane-1-carboxylate deaminase/D-cysteine desulfhydrase-like pyridoxal-dependent ACC family enzyme
LLQREGRTVHITPQSTLTTLAGALARMPRAPVGIFPTPLQPMRRLSQRFDRPVYFKRDDLAGLAMGGSKIRILQFTAGEALAQGADTFVAGGYVQSNHPAQVAAAGAALGVPTHVILDVTKGYEPQGNLLLLDLAGTQVRFTRVGSYDGVLAQCQRLAVRLEHTGRRPRVLTQTRQSSTGNSRLWASARPTSWSARAARRTLACCLVRSPAAAGVARTVSRRAAGARAPRSRFASSSSRRVPFWGSR